MLFYGVIAAQKEALKWSNTGPTLMLCHGFDFSVMRLLSLKCKYERISSHHFNGITFAAYGTPRLDSVDQ